MRTLLLGDIVAAARVLLPLRPDLRAAMLDRLLDQTHAAHCFFKRTGRPHPDWGNGSLMARANVERQKPEPFASDVGYLACLALVIGALMARRTNPGRP